MSFSTTIKNELTKIDTTRSEKIALLSAFFRNNAIYTSDKIELVTENSTVAKYLFQLLKDTYQVTLQIEKKKNNNFTRGNLYMMTVVEKIDLILKDLSVISERGYYLVEPMDYIVSTLEDQAAYLRGLFLAKGSINDPKTSRYHLAFSIDTIEEATFDQD